MTPDEVRALPLPPGMPDLVPHMRNAQTAAEEAGNELVFSVAATHNRVNMLTPTVGALRDSHAHLQESHSGTLELADIAKVMGTILQSTKRLSWNCWADVCSSG